jgi:hypothetical protein
MLSRQRPLPSMLTCWYGDEIWISRKRIEQPKRERPQHKEGREVGVTRRS